MWNKLVSLEGLSSNMWEIKFKSNPWNWMYVVGTNIEQLVSYFLLWKVSQYYLWRIQFWIKSW